LTDTPPLIDRRRPIRHHLALRTHVARVAAASGGLTFVCTGFFWLGLSSRKIDDTATNGAANTAEISELKQRNVEHEKDMRAMQAQLTELQKQTAEFARRNQKTFDLHDDEVRQAADLWAQISTVRGMVTVILDAMFGRPRPPALPPPADPHD
jgi:hypothetical protein